jgi:hypothetical protein
MHEQPNESDAATGRTGDASFVGTIRRQALWAAVAALLLLYFGYNVLWESFGAGGDLIGATIKLGGYLMVASTVLLLIGRPWALAFDGVSAIFIGIMLAISGGILFTQNAGMQAVINVVVGFFFASSGWSNINMFRSIRQTRTELASVAATVDRRADAAGNPMGVGATGQSAEREPDDETPAATNQGHPSSGASESKPSSTPEDVPEGYLSSFADRDPDDEADRDR